VPHQPQSDWTAQASLGLAAEIRLNPQAPWQSCLHLQQNGQQSTSHADQNHTGMTKQPYNQNSLVLSCKCTSNSVTEQFSLLLDTV